MTHEPNDPGNCPICDRGFADRTDLERHAESEHDVLSEFLAA